MTMTAGNHRFIGWKYRCIIVVNLSRRSRYINTAYLIITKSNLIITRSIWRHYVKLLWCSIYSFQYLMLLDHWGNSNWPNGLVGVVAVIINCLLAIRWTNILNTSFFITATAWYVGYCSLLKGTSIAWWRRRYFCIRSRRRERRRVLFSAASGGIEENPRLLVYFASELH